MDIERAKEKFDQLLKIWDGNKENIETEQDVRFQVIDRMLVEVLGWDYDDISTEKHTDSAYIDYLIHSGGRNRFVVEAKKTSKLLVDTISPELGNYKVNGPALTSAQDGIEQAKRYCTNTGVSFAALTTGFQWIGFLAIRTDGKSPDTGKAIVFPTLNAINQKFAVFYDLFSKEGILNNLHQVRIYESEGLQIQHSDAFYQIIAEDQIHLLTKSRLASDLDQIFKGFFTTMSGESDPEMLARCFVESKESKGADSSLQKITRNLINQIEVVSSGEGRELQEQIRAAVETQKGEFVLIIGNKGAGKSTFIDRFFRLVLDKNLREKCLVIRVNLADSSGNLSTIANWLNDRLKAEIENAMFRGANPTYEELQGTFFREYKRWQKGEHKFLYERDKTEFKIKFGEFIAKLIADDPNKYIVRLLQDAIRSRRLMPCIVFDNTDHFPQPFQEHVFQFAQSIHTEMFSFVICPITDRTIWQLSKSGPFQSYATKSFYLPIPSTKEILDKRVIFIKEKIEEQKRIKGDYFLRKGIRLSVRDIQAFAACIEEIFINTEYVSRTIGQLSNHDIRRSLKISNRIVTSPIINIEQLVGAYVSGAYLSISQHQIEKALILGDYNHFYQAHSEFILDIFTVKADQVTSPLLKLSILKLLIDREAQYRDQDEVYMSVEDIQNYFEPARVSRVIVKNHLKELLKYRLANPYDPTDQEIYEEQRLRITHSGKIHFKFALSDDPYIAQMALVTPIRNYELVAEIRELMKSKLIREEWAKIISKFVDYCIEEDRLFVLLPRSDSYDGQSQFRNELKMKWLDPTNI